MKTGRLLAGALLAALVAHGPVSAEVGGRRAPVPIPRGHFDGLALSKLANQQVGIAAGMAADSTGSVLLRTTTQCSVLLTGSGAGGLDTGAVAANTWYAVFLIGLAGNCLVTATTAAAVPAAPTLPAGYTHFAYVGRFKTDSSSNVRADTVLPRGQFYIDATGNSTYTPGASGFRPTSVRFLACGAGGSGGSGARQVSGTAASGGVGGSAGGCMDLTYPYDQLSATVNVTVGAGGALVPPPGTDSTAGVAGNNGNPTFFGATAAAAYAYGSAGCSGDGGRLNASSASGGGGVGVPNTSGGMQPCTAGAAGVAGSGATLGTGGVVGANGTSVWVNGTASVGGGSSVSAAGTGGSAGGRFACAGGAAGGGITTTASINGASAGYAADANVTRGTGGTSGAKDGGAGSAPPYPWLPGSAAGGGYGNFSAGGAGNGGAGAQCAGGGGGGTSVNGSAAGSGGKGGDGYAFVWETR